MVDITPILEALIALLATVITAVLIPYIRSKTSAQKQAELSSLVRVAVSAAEQIYTGGGRGAEKKAYVLDWLRGHGVTVDDGKLDALVEAAVHALNADA